MAKVYITNNSGHDFSKAEVYGSLVDLSTGIINSLKVTGMYREFYAKLKDSSPTDWILHSGPAVMNIIACCIFSTLHGRINLLIWNRGKYIERVLILTTEKEDEKGDVS